MTYTVDTLRDIRAERGEDNDLYFITGADALAQILTWRDVDVLFDLAHFVGCTRPGIELHSPVIAQLPAGQDHPDGGAGAGDLLDRLPGSGSRSRSRSGPTRWYNVLHDLPTPPPPVLHPGTGQPVGPDDLAPLFPMDLILQEVSTEQYVDIPEEVLDVYRLWRPSPLYRAHRLEKALGTPARIYYKYEGARRPARTSRTPRFLRRSTTPRPGSGGSPPRPAPASGARRWRSPAHSTAWTARSGRCGRRTTRSPTGGS